MQFRQSKLSVALPATIALLATVSGPVRAQSWQEELQKTDHGAQPLIRWQRSIADARELSRLSGKPMVVCVNFDGENASEAFAHNIYKNAEFAALLNAFVPVIASPSTHYGPGHEADHDEAGRRLTCPRFGVVTCGEHVAAEPQAFTLYFAGERVVPRHIGVAPDGSVLFDLKYLQDLGVVAKTLREHAVLEPDPLRRLFATPDAAARAELERTYVEADPAARADLLRTAASAPYRPYDLVRMGLAEEAAELRALAAHALATTVEADGLELLLATLDDERFAAQREVLDAALTRLAATNDPAAQLARRARDVLGRGSDTVDVAAWRAALQAAGPQEAPRHTPEEPGMKLDELLPSGQPAPTDAPTLLEAARTNLDFAALQIAGGGDPTFFLLDAQKFAEKADAVGAAGADTASVRARAAWYLSELDQAANLAARAVPGLLSRAGSAEAAEVLDILARARTSQTYGAMNAGTEWDLAGVADALAAYEVLLVHPLGQERQAVAGVDLLTSLGLQDHAQRMLRTAIARWPESSDLHTRLRGVVESTDGLDAFTRVYADLRAEAGDPAPIDWFAGYAELVLAENYAQSEGLEQTDAAYERAVAAFERSLAEREGYRDSVDHFVALALAGRARVALLAGEVEPASRFATEAVRRRPASADLPDGLERTPREAVVAVRRQAERAKRTDLVEELDQVIDELDRGGDPAAEEGGEDGFDEGG